MASLGDWAIAGPFANSSWMRSFLHPEDAYKKAGREAEKGWQEAKGYEMPYYNAGTSQIGKLTGAQDQLMHPDQLESQWASTYETSPYAKQLMDQSKNAGLDAASSMGLLGSSSALGNIQTGASNIMNKEREQYMKDLMEKYMKGVGIGTNMFDTGATTGTNLANQAVGAGENRGAATYGAASAPGEMFKSLMNAAMKYALGGE